MDPLAGKVSDDVNIEVKKNRRKNSKLLLRNLFRIIVITILRGMVVKVVRERDGYVVEARLVVIQMKTKNKKEKKITNKFE